MLTIQSVKKKKSLRKKTYTNEQVTKAMNNLQISNVEVDQTVTGAQETELVVNS